MKNTVDTNSFVALDHFSGPLDLLLQLIRNQKMDIFQIDIYKITSKYVEYLEKIPKPNLEEAGEFIRIASLLLYIKSKTLIPKEDIEEEHNELDLKEKLSLLLSTYQKFQTAGELLYNRSLLERDYWKSKRTLHFKNSKEAQVEIDKEKGQFQLIQAYQKNLLNKKSREHYIIRKPIPTLLHRIKQMAEIFTVGSRLKFNQILLIKKEKHNRLLSFLSLLELSKTGFVSLFQNQLFSNIDILVKKALTKEAIKGFSNEESTSKKLDREPLI